MEKIWIRVVSFILIVISIGGIAQNNTVAAPIFESNDTVVISEPTDGMLGVIGGTIIIEGDVNGTIFVAGNTITIKGNVLGEVFLAGNTIRTDTQAEFRRDVFAAGNSVLIGSAVGRDLFIGSNSAHIQNRVGRNGYIGSNTITFNDSGRIIGDLYYQSEQEAANINEYVQGEINYQKPMQQTNEMMFRTIPWWTVLRALGAIISAVLIWLFLRGVTQERWMTVSPSLIQRPVLLILIGLGLTLLLSILILLSLISIVLLNLGFLLSFVFILFLFFGKIVTASVIGKYLLETRIPARNYRGLIAFAVAYTLLLFFSYLPYVGWVISLLCIFYTVGLAFREAMIHFRAKPI